MMDIDRMDRDGMERAISQAIGSLILLELFHGEGIAEVMSYLVRKRKFSFCMSGAPCARHEGLACGGEYAISIFCGLALKGHADGQDYNRVMVLAMGQALGILPVILPSLSQASRDDI